MVGSASLESLERRTLLANAVDAGLGFLPKQFNLVHSGGYLSNAQKGQPLAVALKYLKANAKSLGLAAAEIDRSIVTDQYTDKDTGVTHIYLRQTFNGLEVVNADLGIHIAKDGKVIAVGGGFVSGLKETNSVKPNFSALTAVNRAASKLGLRNKHDAEVLEKKNNLARGTRLRNRDLSKRDIPARLHYVPVEGGGVKLAWNVEIQTTDGKHWYTASVADGGTGELLYNADYTDNESYNVLPRPVETPADGPRQIVTNPSDPTASPFGWHDTNGVAGVEFTDTRGNNVRAQEDVNADNVGGFRPDGGPTLNFDFPLDLSLPPSGYQPAAITNLFYWNNIIHDVTYAYGFTEAAGNFQQNNYGRGGLGNDWVQADAQDGSGVNNANFSTPPDGSPGLMQMYTFTNGRDGDLDNMIIVHEYGHGISNRLTGGPGNASALNALQSGGMGEGWSDWFGLMFTQKTTDLKTGSYPVGTYVLNNTAGIRRKPYAFDMAIDTLTWDAYGTTGSGGGVTRSVEVHDSGEIWCSALWDMNWLLIDKYGFNPNIQQGYTGPGSAGNVLAMKLVMDAMKLQPANPTFINARDALVQADVVLTGGQNAREIWTAFARRGLGANASTANANATTVTLSFDLPASLSDPFVQSQSPLATALLPGPVTQLSFTFNKAMNTSTFSIVDDVASFTGPGGVDLLSSITGSSWSANSQTLTITFSGQTTDGQYALTIGPNVAAAADGHLMNQDGDTIAGESSDDRYAGTFRVDTLAMAVTSTVPANNTPVTLPFTTLDVNLNEPVLASTIGTNDITLSQGTVVGASQVDADTIRYTLAGITSEGTFTFNAASGVWTDLVGNPNLSYAGVFLLDVGTVPFPIPLDRKKPDGSLTHAGKINGAISFAADADNFTIPLDGGQQLSIYVDPAAALRPQIELRDSSNNLLTSLLGSTGNDALLQNIPILANDTYTVSISGGTTVGTFTMGLSLNAARESEAHGSGSNDIRTSAQPLTPGFINIGGNASRAGVFGVADVGGVVLPAEIEPNNSTASANDASVNFTGFTGNVYQMGLVGSNLTSSDHDFWNIGTLQAGDVITITQSGTASGRGSLQDPLVIFYRGSAASPTFVTSDDDAGTGLDSMIYRMTVPVTDTYYIDSFVFSGSGSYQLNVYLEDNGTAPNTGGSQRTEIEANGTAATATNVSNAWRRVNYVSHTSGALPDGGDSDYFKYTFAAGDLITIVGNSSDNQVQSALLNASGQVLASDSGDSFAFPDAPIYTYFIPSAGTYYVRMTGPIGATYSADVYLASNFTPPAPFVLNDHYSFQLTTGESLSLALKGVTNDSVSMRLLSSGGTTLAIAHGADNASAVINDFVSPVTGTFYVAVSGGNGTEYTLAAMKNATFDTEPNDSTAAAQPILASKNAGVQRVLGSIGNSDVDRYSIALTAGALLNLATTTPGDGPGEPGNTLNPRVRVLDSNGNEVASDDNSAADGRNALLNYTATDAGTYYVEVSGSGGSTGDYVLAANGNTAAAPVFAIVGSDPTNGSNIAAPPTQIRIDFNDTLLITTLTPVDLLVNGSPSIAVTMLDGDSALFTLPALSGTSFTATMAAGAASDIQGTPVQPFSATFTVDSGAPRIVSSSLQEGDAVPTGNFSYVVTFSEPMKKSNLNEADFELVGPAGILSATSFSYNAAGDVLTLNYSDLVEGNYALALRSGNGKFEDVVGNDLDGEPIAFPLPPNQSGDGVAGGDFTVGFQADIGTTPFPGEFVAKPPAGSLIYDPSVSGTIGAAGDVDSFTMSLDAGQTLSLAAGGSGGLKNSVEVRDPDGALIGSATAPAPDAGAILQTVPITKAGTYTISITGADGTTGAYSIFAYLNAALEDEYVVGGPSNSSRATAQDINGSFIELAEGATRGAVLGASDFGTTPLPAEVEPNNSIAQANDSSTNFQFFGGSTAFDLAVKGAASSSSDGDFYSLGQLDSGDTLWITVAGASSSRGTLAQPTVELYRGTPGSLVLVASDVDSGIGSDSHIGTSVGDTDNYYIKVLPQSGSGTYDLSVRTYAYLGKPTGGTVTSESENNDSAESATDLSTSWRREDYVAHTAGYLDPNDGGPDFFSFHFTAGDIVNFSNYRGGPANMFLHGPGGSVIASDTDAASQTYLWTFQIETTGTYTVEITPTESFGVFYDLYTELATNTAPPTEAPAGDWYSFTAGANDHITLGIQGTSFSAPELALTLYDADGTLLATGNGTATNLDDVISDFTVPASGTYYVNIASQNTIEYALVVTKNATFNQDFDPSAAQAIGTSNVMLGGVTTTSDIDGYDDYSIDLVAGQQLRLSTLTPADGPGAFGNTLDPLLELFGPNDSLVASNDNGGNDGRNAVLIYTATQTGTYKFRISGAGDTSGEYIIVRKTPALAQNDDAETLEDQDVTIDVLANDINPDPGAVTLSISGQPQHGSVAINADNTITYTPQANYAGADSFEYTLETSTGATTIATVNIAIEAVADVPTVVANNVSGPEGSPIALDLAAGTDDADGSETLELTIEGVPSGAVLNHGTNLGSGVWSVTQSDLTGLTFKYNDNGVFALTLRGKTTESSNNETAEATAPFTVTVNNALPNVSPIGGPATGVRGQALAFSGAFTDPGLLDTHEVSWDFGNGVVIPFHASTDAAALTPSTVYTASGTYTVTLTVRDDDGGTKSVTKPVTISAFTFTAGDLYVGGTTGNDKIKVDKDGTKGYKLEINGQKLGTFAATGRIVIYGLAGNDELEVSDDTKLPAELYGGDGDDKLKGGGGNEILVGGIGNDKLEASQGRDILIGGDGADTAIGNGGDDILIAGSTAHDENPFALRAIQAEWVRTDKQYGDRIATLLAGSLGPSFVFNDTQKDDLQGKGDKDWFFRYNSGSAKTSDRVEGPEKGEIITELT